MTRRMTVIGGALLAAASLAALGAGRVQPDASFVADVTRRLPGDHRFLLLASGGIAGWHEPCG